MDRDDRTSSPERKLAAIMSADVVGYSRLMELDETETLTRLSNLRNAIDALIAQREVELLDRKATACWRSSQALSRQQHVQSKFNRPSWR